MTRQPLGLTSVASVATSCFMSSSPRVDAGSEAATSVKAIRARDFMVSRGRKTGRIVSHVPHFVRPSQKCAIPLLESCAHFPGPLHLAIDCSPWLRLLARVQFFTPRYCDLIGYIIRYATQIENVFARAHAASCQRTPSHHARHQQPHTRFIVAMSAINACYHGGRP
jgi:hypothetical protein